MPGFEAKYEVSSDGDVRRVGSDRLAIDSARPPRAWYRYVTLYGDETRTMSVHRIVALAFLGPRPRGLVIDHIDADKTNNRASNLEYVTSSENTRRAVRLGRLLPRTYSPEERRTLVRVDVPAQLYAALAKRADREARRPANMAAVILRDALDAGAHGLPATTKNTRGVFPVAIGLRHAEHVAFLASAEKHDRTAREHAAALLREALAARRRK